MHTATDSIFDMAVLLCKSLKIATVQHQAMGLQECRTFPSWSACRATRTGASMANPLFHLAFPVDSIAKARAFYGRVLGCPEGRSAETWVDFDFYGHQLVAHL